LKVIVKNEENKTAGAMGRERKSWCLKVPLVKGGFRGIIKFHLFMPVSINRFSTCQKIRNETVEIVFNKIGEMK
jgi:hypothetical protein